LKVKKQEEEAELKRIIFHSRFLLTKKVELSLDMQTSLTWLPFGLFVKVFQKGNDLALWPFLAFLNVEENCIF